MFIYIFILFEISTERGCFLLKACRWKSSIFFVAQNINRFLRRTTFGILDGQASLLNICRREVWEFTDSHTAPIRELQHMPIPGVQSSKDDLIVSFFIENIPLMAYGRLNIFLMTELLQGLVRRAGRLVLILKMESGCLGNVHNVPPVFLAGVRRRRHCSCRREALPCLEQMQ